MSLRPEYFLYISDPSLQTADWADKVISRRRMDWRKIVSDQDYRRNKALVLSVQDLQKSVKDHFDDQKFLDKTKFQPLPIMEKPRNIIIDQAREAGTKPYIKAVDPSATVDRKQDMFRIKTMQQHVADANKVRSKVGVQTPYSIAEKEFNGNVPEFNKLGFNPEDESDVQFFFDTHYKLNYEGYAQTTVMAYLAASKCEEDISRYVIDVLSNKIVCTQKYVSRTTGQIIIKYLQPNHVYAIYGDRRDATDAAVRGWEKPVTVQELIGMLGNVFNFERDWLWLIYALNYGSETTYDGFIKGGSNYFIDPAGNMTDVDKPSEEKRQYNMLDFDDVYSNSYNYKVYLGFIEWEQLCVHTEKRNPETGQRFTVNSDYTPSPKSPYEKEEWQYFTTKQSHYVAMGAYSQKLFGYGDMYMMPTMGDSDEFSAGSISVIREEGLSAAAIAEPYIDLANYAYYRMLWAIGRSKPDVWDWHYESIRDMAMKLTQNVNQGTLGAKAVANTMGDAVFDLIDRLDKKNIRIHTTPNLDGQPVGGGGNQNIKIPGAVDRLALELRELILEWAERQIGDKLGLAGIANAQAPNPRDGLKLNQMYLRQSKAAIGYIPRMIDLLFRQTADTVLNYVQDILQFPDTIAYKYLYKLVGQDAIDALSVIKDATPRRYAIYATSYSDAPDRQEQLQDAAIAFQKGLITFPEYQLLKLIEDPRVCAKQAAYFQEKGEKRKEAQQKSANDFAMAMRDKAAKDTFDLEKMKADAKILAQRISTDGFIYQADKMYASKIDAANVVAGGQQQQQQTKLEDRKEEMQAKANIDLQESLIAPGGI